MKSILLLCLTAPLWSQTRLPPPATPRLPASHTRTEKPSTAHSRAATPAASVSDAEIEKDFRARLAKSKLAAGKFTIRVQGGVATLEGRTDVVQHKGTATRMAKSAGARAVNNRIEISDAARARAEANLAKGRRRAQVARGETRSH
jgi:osmotically-inducible protein OsmY